MEIKTITEDMAKALKNPLPPVAIKQHPSQKHLSTIKPIYVTERLNTVFGIGKWQLKTELLKLNEGKTSTGKAEYTSLMKTIIEIPEYGIYYECIAGSTNTDMGDSTKGGTTDAITKIGSYLGIGIDVFKGNPDVKPEREPSKPNNQQQRQEPQQQKSNYHIQKEGMEGYVAASTPKTEQPLSLKATPEQNKQILILLNNPVITKEEKEQTLKGINSFTEERANLSIAKLKKTIEERKPVTTA